MSRHKAVRERNDFSLWPFVWLSAVVVAIFVTVLADQARGDQPVAAYATSSPAGEADDPRLRLGRQDQWLNRLVPLLAADPTLDTPTVNRSPRERSSALSGQQDAT